MQNLKISLKLGTAQRVLGKNRLLEGGYLFRTEVVGGTCAAFVGFLEIFAQKAGKSDL